MTGAEHLTDGTAGGIGAGAGFAESIICTRRFLLCYTEYDMDEDCGSMRCGAIRVSCPFAGQLIRMAGGPIYEKFYYNDRRLQ